MTLPWLGLCSWNARFPYCSQWRPTDTGFLAQIQLKESKSTETETYLCYVALQIMTNYF